MSPSPTLVPIRWRDRPVEIEVQWLGKAEGGEPLLVFLHEGLGSVSMWRDFPQRLCQSLGVRGLVYSRPGYGQSTPRAADEDWAPDFMHRQAYEVLPQVLEALAIDPQAQPLWLFGHSDGGSIALLHAARFGQHLAGIVVLAPHILVESLSVHSIELARQAYLHTDLRQKLARHHQDPDSAFWGWNRIWLHPDFRNWRIVEDIASIQCPILAVQGLDDAYGTLEQIRGIARICPQTELVELPDCGHSPHRDQPEALIAAVQGFIARAGTFRSGQPGSQH